jgi:hypothetical protein
MREKDLKKDKEEQKREGESQWDPLSEILL